MATQKTVKALQDALQANPKAGTVALVAGDLLRAAVLADGDVSIKEALTALKQVDVADVDLLLTFANGDHVIIPHGALDALGPTPPEAIFLDQKMGLADLFKLVGVTNPAKSGSLRLVSENIDANPPAHESAVQTDLPAPAPMVKVSAGAGLGAGKGPGTGAGEGDGQVPDVVVPMATAQPSVYRSGQSSQSIQDLLKASGLGTPNFTDALYTSSQYKLTPSGRTDLPQGAFDPSASVSQLTVRASPTSQAAVETINGTSGADTINFNPAFSAGVGQWSKTLHLAINNFAALTSIQLVFNAPAISQIPGFDLQGLGGAVVTRDSPTSNSWHLTPTTDMLLNGADIAIVYNVAENAPALYFGADIIIAGSAGPYAFSVTNNLNFTWLDAASAADFTVTTLAGDPVMVLPSGGVGVIINAGDGNDTINAGAGPDVIHGGLGDDVINAGSGNDTLDGGMGADALNGGSGTDTASYENANSGVLASLTDSSQNTGEAAGDSYTSIENLTGSAFNDTLIGDASNNVLSGGAGDDVLEGRGGVDTLIGGAGNNSASYAHAAAAVIASLTDPTVNTGDAAGDSYTQIQNLTGSAFNDTLIGDSGINLLSGGGGNDVLEGMAGADTLIGGDGNNTASYAHAAVGLRASLSTPTSNTGDAAGDSYTQIQNLEGSAFKDTLIGDGGNNILSGGAGDDVLEGMGGPDALNGGAGFDTASYENASNSVAASLTASLAGFSSAGDAQGDSYNSIENLSGSAFSDTLVGNSGANTIHGGAGDDVLEGMGGADTLDGGSGANTASYEHAGGSVTASLTDASINLGDALGDSYTQIQNLTGSVFDDVLVGDSGANIVNGGSGDDVLEGLAGADVLSGGAGSDSASYEHALSAVAASLSTGLAGFSALGDAAGDSYFSIEKLTGSTYNDKLIGDGNANVLSGGAGDDVLEGMAGADTLIGGVGSDTASYEHATRLVEASLTTGLAGFSSSGDAQGDTFTSIENLTGSAMDDKLVGDGNANVLSGGAGDDVLEGLGGTDSLIGGAGSNTASYEHATLAVTASLTNAGINSGDAAGDSYTQIQNLTGSGLNDTLIGDANSNVLSGGLGDDVLEGMGGADTLIGGAGTGNDSASYEHASAFVDASLTTGLPGFGSAGDAQGDSYSGIENLIGSAFNDNLIGDANNNTLSGGAGNDVLEGLGGADVLDGGDGVNTASYEYASGPVAAALSTGLSGFASAGDAVGDSYINIANLTGSVNNDILIGDGGNNVIHGGAGDDVLEGLGGADTLK
ncbi:MAG: calcium-binding protein, partial [Betaproteobacteria bacterium]